MDKKKKETYLDYYQEYLKEHGRNPGLDSDYWREKRKVYYAKQYNQIMIDGDRLRELQWHLEGDKDYMWIKENLTELMQNIDQMIMNRDHVDDPMTFYHNVESMLTEFLQPATGNEHDYLREALDYIKAIKENGMILEEIQRRIEALSLLIRDIEQDRWWWSKPHQDDVDSVYRYQRVELNKKIAQAFDFTKNKIIGIDGVDPTEYGLNDDPNQYKDAFNKREKQRLQNN